MRAKIKQQTLICNLFIVFLLTGVLHDWRVLISWMPWQALTASLNNNCFIPYWSIFHSILMKCHQISTGMIYWQTIVIDYKLLIWSRIRTDNIEYCWSTILSTSTKPTNNNLKLQKIFKSVTLYIKPTKRFTPQWSHFIYLFCLFSFALIFPPLCVTFSTNMTFLFFYVNI